MVRLLGADSYHVQINPGRFIIVTEVVRVASSSSNSSSSVNSDAEGDAEDGGATGGSNSTKRRIRRRKAARAAGTSPSNVNNSNTVDRGITEEVEGGSPQQQGLEQEPVYCAAVDALGNLVAVKEQQQPRNTAETSDSQQQEQQNIDEEEDVDYNDEDDEEEEEAGGEYIERVLHMQCGNMFDVRNIASADIVMMETDIPAEQHGKLQSLLGEMKDDAKVLTYLDLRRIWEASGAPPTAAGAGGAGAQQLQQTVTNSSSGGGGDGGLAFKQLELNRHQADRYPTSWSVQRGHHFYLWNKVRRKCRKRK